MEASAAPVPVRLGPPSSPNGSAVATTDAPAPAEAVADGVRPLEDVALVAPRHRISGATLVVLAVIAGVAAVVLGAWAFVSSVREPNTVDVIRTAPISASGQAISLLSKPSTQRLPLRNSSGAITLAVAPAGRGVLVLDRLAIAPVGLSYQAWAFDPRKRPHKPVPAAAFTGVETVVPLAARVPPGWFLGVTVEKSSGASKPSDAYRFGAQRPAAAR